MYSMNIKKMVGLYIAQSSQVGKNCQEWTSHKNKKKNHIFKNVTPQVGK